MFCRCFLLTLTLWLLLLALLQVIKLIEAVEKLKAEVGVPSTIKEVVGDKPEAEWFYMSTTLDMSYQAFDDQCTGANPR
jgi:acetaldehyde dehydrogenase/alcohol dehydrogenase